MLKFDALNDEGATAWKSMAPWPLNISKAPPLPSDVSAATAPAAVAKPKPGARSITPCAAEKFEISIRPPSDLTCRVSRSILPAVSVIVSVPPLTKTTLPVPCSTTDELLPPRSNVLLLSPAAVMNVSAPVPTLIVSCWL